jgi:hypothetical protein
MENIWCRFSRKTEVSIKKIGAEMMLEGPKFLGGAANRWGRAT